MSRGAMLIQKHFWRQIHSLPCQKVCWKCKNKLKCSSIFCTKAPGDNNNSCCGIIQPVTEGVLYTNIFFPEKETCSLIEQFKIKNDVLKKNYLDLQKKVHPDFWFLKSEKLGEIAKEQSSFINRGFYILSHPERRARYILELLGFNLNENKIEEKNYLKKIFELNFKLRASSEQERENAYRIIKDLEQALLLELDESFNKGDLNGAAECTQKLHYITRTLSIEKDS